jgi:ABC-type branched-subunit amino acid transport system ATPase component
MTASLDAVEIDFAYGQTQILFGASLHAEPGESLALVGTNGAGKSTLLRVVAGLERPSAGRVRLGDADITGLPAHRVTERGLVLIQGGKAVFPDLTVADNLDIFALTARRQTRSVAQRRSDVLATFPALQAALPRRAGTLSGGQQQQLALAKALLLTPKVLCIDELSLGIAPIVVEALISVIRDIERRGVTIVLVEQSLNVAAALCRRAVFMEKGAVRFDGLVADLIERDDLARAVFLSEQPVAANFG